MKKISGKIVTFKNGGPVGHCQVQLYRSTPSGIAVFVATELPDNPGPSITNAAEVAFMNSCIKFNILPEQAVWVEHYPADNKSRLEGTFDLVGFKLDQDGTPKQPVWTPLGLDATIQMTGATVMELTGEEPSEMYLEAKRQADIDKAVADALADDDDEEVFNE